MIRARRVVARGLGSVRPHEQGAGVGDPGHRLLGVRQDDRQVLGGIRIGEGDRRISIGRQDDDSAREQAALEDVAARRERQAADYLQLDSIRKLGFRSHENRR